MPYICHESSLYDSVYEEVFKFDFADAFPMKSVEYEEFELEASNTCIFSLNNEVTIPKKM